MKKRIEPNIRSGNGNSGKRNIPPLPVSRAKSAGTDGEIWLAGLSSRSVTRFREFIGETWENLKHPCSRKMIEQAFSYLQSREEAANPEEFILLHGAAHAENTLKKRSGDGFKLIEPAAENTAAEPGYMNELHRFLSCEYGFRVKNILPAKRGFYVETWNVQTENGNYFLKVDYWNHQKKYFQNSLSVVRYMTDSGISFIPQIIQTKDGHLYSSFRQGTAVVFEHIPGKLSEDYSTAQLYNRLAKIYRLKIDGLEMETEDFGVQRIDTYVNLKTLPELPAEVKTAFAKNLNP